MRLPCLLLLATLTALATPTTALACSEDIGPSPMLMATESGFIFVDTPRGETVLIVEGDEVRTVTVPTLGLESHISSDGRTLVTLIESYEDDDIAALCFGTRASLELRDLEHGGRRRVIARLPPGRAGLRVTGVRFMPGDRRVRAQWRVADGEHWAWGIWDLASRRRVGSVHTEAIDRGEDDDEEAAPPPVSQWTRISSAIPEDADYQLLQVGDDGSYFFGSALEGDFTRIVRTRDMRVLMTVHGTPMTAAMRSRDGRRLLLAYREWGYSDFGESEDVGPALAVVDLETGRVVVQHGGQMVTRVEGRFPLDCATRVDDASSPLNVRARPSSRGEVSGTIAHDTTVTVAERRGRWARLTAPTAGWAWADNLRESCRLESR